MKDLVDVRVVPVMARRSYGAEIAESGQSIVLNLTKQGWTLQLFHPRQNQGNCWISPVIFKSVNGGNKISDQPGAQIVELSNKMLKINDVMTKLGVSEPTLRLWIQKKSIPFVRVGKLIRFESSDLNRWIESRKVVVVQSRP